MRAVRGKKGSVTPSPGAPLVTLDRVDVVLRGARVLRAATLQLREGESWAVVGRNGSGKSTLLRALRGDVWPAPSSAGRRLFHLGGEASESPIGARERIALVAPEAQDEYVRRDWDLPVEAVIRSGFWDQLYPQQAATPAQEGRVREVVALLGIEPLVGRSILELSRGEGRKILLARALAPAPALLLLDEVCDGLDRPSRAALLELLSRVARAGTPIAMATHRPEEVVPEVERVAVVEDGTVARVGGRELLGAAVVPPARPPDVHGHPPAGGGDRVLFALEEVDVLVGGRAVLDGITWTMRAGEHWAVLGPNGAGKSTLLRLLAGEEQAHGGTVRRLDLGARASVWDVYARVALVGSELQARHRYDLRGEEVILSGFTASIGLAVDPSAGERAAAADLVARLGLGDLAGRRILGLSYGELRKLLLARALVAGPEVLLLDEPVSGLDAASRAWMLAALDRLAREGTALVLVTHHDDEIVPAVNRVARLDGGRMVSQGPRG